MRDDPSIPRSRSSGSSRVQRSVARGQRGWKRHPAGGCAGLGRSPSRTTRGRRASSVGVRDGDRREQGPRVGMQRAGEDVVAGPELHDPAEVHDGHAIADVPDHGQVVGDEEIGEPQLVFRSSSRFTTCAWMDTSSAETGSSATMKRGLVASARAIADALALPARELVRVAVGELGPESHQRQELLHARRAVSSRVPRAWTSRGSPTMRRHVHAGVERRVRVLEDHLHVPPRSRKARAGQGREVRRPGSAPRLPWASRAGAAPVPVVDLPQPLSPTRPSVSPSADVEGEPVHGGDGAHLSSQQPTLHRVVLLRGHGPGRGAPSHVLPPPAGARRAGARSSRSGGFSWRQRSTT